MSEKNKPSLCWEINETEYTITFGYMNNEPTAALFIKGKPEIMALIPQEVLGIALLQGWGQDDDPASQPHITCDCRSCDCGDKTLPQPDYFNAFHAIDKYLGLN